MTGKAEVQKMADTANIMAGVEESTVSLNDGTEVEVYKCKAKNVGKVLSFATFVMGELGITDFQMPDGVDFASPTLILQLISNASDRLFELAADLSSLSKDEIDDLYVDDAVMVVAKVIEVNKDFFLKSVLPKIPLLMVESAESTQ